MAHTEVSNENMLATFRDLHKIAGMDSKYVYDMLVNGMSAEEVVRKSVKDQQTDYDFAIADEEAAGGDSFAGIPESDFEADAFADELLDNARFMDEMTKFSEAYPIKGKEAIDPYIDYLQKLMAHTTDDSTTTKDELPVVNPNDIYQPWGFTWLGSTEDDRKMWEYDKTIAKSLANFREEILPLLETDKLQLKHVVASMKRLQNLVRLGDRGQPDYRNAVLDMRSWMRLDEGGLMVAGTPGAEEFNSAVEQVRNAMVMDELGGSKWDDIMSNLVARIEKLGAEWGDPGRVTGGSGARPEGVATTYEDLPKTDFDVMYRDQSNRGLFMNELNKIPGSGTFEMEQNKDDMWQQAETVYLLGQGPGENEIQTQGGIVQANFGDTFSNWAQRWLANPKELTEEYNAYQAAGYQRGDPRGLALKAHENALQMVDLEKGLKSISVDGAWYDLTGWMRDNPGRNVNEWFRQQTNIKMRLDNPDEWGGQDVLDAPPDSSQNLTRYLAWKEVYDKFETAYNTTLGNTAGLFHPNFSGNVRRWRSLYLVPNTIGMTSVAAHAIRRQLNIIADTMRESGKTYAEIAELLTRQSMGPDLKMRGESVGKDWAQDPLTMSEEEMKGTDPSGEEYIDTTNYSNVSPTLPAWPYPGGLQTPELDTDVGNYSRRQL